VVEEKMPFLKEICGAYQIAGVNWTGFAAEYEGNFPGNGYQSHYLVLCLSREKDLISFTITANSEIFEKNSNLYNWLLRNALIIED